MDQIKVKVIGYGQMPVKKTKGAVRVKEGE